MDWPHEIAARLSPVAAPLTLTSASILLIVLVALAAVWWPQSWTLLRPLVTLSHELGHALAGMAVGRRFTGFVLRSDMSGHAVTVGPNRRGPLVATTWAGYPAPALLGGAAIWLSVAGWAAPLLTVLLVILVAVLIRVRSAYTALVMVATLVGLGALWWWRADALQAQVLIALGTVLVAGAWRHLVAVAGTRDPGSDPRRLAALTGMPAPVWLGSWTVVAGGVTWAAAQLLLAVT